ncbi:MAG TPA: preprotein translocase subunit SecA [Clostridia bacterium]|nr:preprotein translocase subunit SecA [Clostridia bacterium]
MGFLDFFKKRLGQGELDRLGNQTEEIQSIIPSMEKLSDEALQEKTIEFKERLKKGETLDDLLPEAFALVCEASKRTLGMSPYPEQIMGAIILHEGRIAEMKTGEGKTLVATMPLYLNALEGKGAHLVTVNDYLASYQSQWMGQLYQFLGLSVGCLTNDLKGEDRHFQYAADITYGTNNEFGFDYLRDNMAIYQSSVYQRPLNYAIVDEVDSILIDEARTPLIISGQGNKSTDLYGKAEGFTKTITKDDVIIDEKANTIMLSEEGGMDKAEKYFSVDNLADMDNMEIYHHINQAIRARFLMKKDVNYVVKDGEIVIVDEFTGRLMPGRRYSSGLHQAIEAKEGISIRKESQTLATITLQNFFRMYSKLAGMTGTAKTEEEEFREIYGMDVVEIPTNRPVQRKDLGDVIYGHSAYKYKAIIEEIIQRHQTGQPILVGTVSIETSEYISKQLKKAGIPHEVLNAKHHHREAEIIAQAGRFGAVTIATNMAGRGTDIMLGGNLEFVLRKELRKRDFEDDVISYALSPFDYEEEEVIKAKSLIKELRGPIVDEINKEAERVKNAGGLHVLGTERHEARRIDFQLRGRSGRQGDPGSSQFFLSLDDDLLRIFMSENVIERMRSLGFGEDMPIQHKMLTKSIESAQKKVEANNYGIRRYVLQYDQVMNEQRRHIYGNRNAVLNNENQRDNVMDMARAYIEDYIDMNRDLSPLVKDWDVKSLDSQLKNVFFEDTSFLDELPKDCDAEGLQEFLNQHIEEFYQKREELYGIETMRGVERAVILSVVDQNWIDHIDAMDSLKQGIGLRAIGQIDPVQAYQIEGFAMYEEMIDGIREETLRILFKASFKEGSEQRKDMAVVTGESSGQKTTAQRRVKKVGRNDPCPCGSGKKYKYCCGRN